MKKKLNKIQLEFIKEHFFKLTHAIGWKQIADNLLTNEHCIVAGTECIWRGGIGNFIKVEKSLDAIGCLVYKFDVNTFLESEFFKEAYNAKIEALYKEMENAEENYKKMKK